MNNLKIYKASAGSGKTYTLAKEYISTLLESNDPQEYRHTLAVTFTNKATEEMKSRIIKELHILATNPAKSQFVTEKKDPICDSKPETMEKVREKSGRILTALLNDYSSFNVCTIDKFFQGIMRSFAKEFGQHYKYNIELDEKGSLERAIDRMYSELDREESREVLNWLVDYAISKVESSGGWNIKGEINDISQILLKETFAQYASTSQTPSERMLKIKKLQGEFAKCRADFESKAKRIAVNATKRIAANNLELEDFKYGKNSGFSQFYKILENKKREVPQPGNRFLKLDDITTWGKKVDDFTALAQSGLMQDITDLQELYEKDYRRYATAVILEKYAFAWGVLGMVRSYLNQWCADNNIVLLSESSNLLNRIIDGSQTPFIYEKVGTYIRHFMLDEFQDTSTLQWKNFIPLLEESISNGKNNLIVGDVKQSIYRWRNSNWTILGKEVDKVFDGYIDQHILEENFRSNKNVIDFNNRFFTYFSQNIEDIVEGDADGKKGEIEKMYSDCAQRAGRERESNGYVEISIHSNVKENQQEYCNAVVKRVQMLIDKGYQPCQIGILTWKNKEGEMVAKALMEHGIGVATVGTLTLGSNAAVCSVIDSLKSIEQNNDAMRKAKLAIEGNGQCGILSQEDIEAYKELPLYQMAEAIIRNTLPNDGKRESQFLCALLDSIIEYSFKYGGSLQEFLKWWEEAGQNQTISSSLEKSAVNIVTIHKSKGLAYDAVIVPFFEWDLNPGTRSSIWSSQASESFGYDQPVNVSCSKALAQTLFDQDYQREITEHKADIINMAYVAFTRAKSALMVMCQYEDEESNGKNSSKVLTSSLLRKFIEENELLDASNGDRLDFRSKDDTFSLGEISAPGSDEKSDDEKIEAIESPFSIPFDSHRRKTALTTGSINDEEISLKEMGIQMHDAFATIEYLEDIESIEGEETRNAVMEAVESVKDYGWFWSRKELNGRSVVNERSIITPEGEVFRPDRIILYKNETGENCATVVDYKFGHYKGTNPKYVSQVQGYMNLLKETGCKEVTGYLWYVNSTVEEVKLN